MAVGPFLDTSVLLAGLIDFGPQSGPAQQLLHAVAEKTVPNAATAWHCCLEFYSVSTRLPPEFRLTAADAVQLLESEVFARLAVHDHFRDCLTGGGYAPPGPLRDGRPHGHADVDELHGHVGRRQRELRAIG